MINLLTRLTGCALVAICDKDAPSLAMCEKIARETSTKVTLYPDFDGFFDHDMDAVVLANYANEHAPYAARLLRSGRHVLSESVPVETLGQAVELVEAAEQSAAIYAYAENCCYTPVAVEMRRLYRRGVIGEFTHGECEYVHDVESIYPDITYGDKNHWRNNIYASFYCTHSLGPIIFITGTRPVKVVGFETPNAETMANLGWRAGLSAMEILQMNNNATVKSLHGFLRRYPHSHWACLYGKKGMMEADRWQDEARLYLYEESRGDVEGPVCYRPTLPPSSAANSGPAYHTGDSYMIRSFLARIRGDDTACDTIDVYQAMDMGLPGILAHRSICSGNTPVEVPDFRNKEVREVYRGDNWCTNPRVAGDNLAPLCSFGSPELPDSVYERVRRMWLAKQQKR